MEFWVVDLGQIDYMEAFRLQDTLLALRQQDKISDVLLLLEHPPVLTIGRSGSRSNLLVSEASLKAMGVHVYDVNRGGDITYHGPGQIVGYPIVNLSGLGKDVRQFVRNLEEVFIQLLAENYGISAGRDPVNTGVWIGNEKITAIGLAVKRWVTQHGFAFNVNTDISHFNWIRPCGIMDKGVTSLEKLKGCTLDLQALKKEVAEYFGRVYPFTITHLDKDELITRIGRENHGKAGLAEG